MNNNKKYWFLHPLLQVFIGSAILACLYFILLFQQDWLVRLITALVTSGSLGTLLLLEVFWLAGHYDASTENNEGLQKNGLKYRIIYSIILILLGVTFVSGLYHIMVVEKFLVDRFIVFLIFDGTLGFLGFIATVWLIAILKSVPVSYNQSENYRVFFPLALVCLGVISLACLAYIIFIAGDWASRILAFLTVDSAVWGLFFLVIFWLGGRYKDSPVVKNENSLRKAKNIKILYGLTLSLLGLIFLISSFHAISVEETLTDKLAIFIAIIGTLFFLFIASTVWFIALSNSLPMDNDKPKESLPGSSCL